MKALIYGAGNIGRGFIAQIFFQSGYEVSFIDTAEPVIDAVNRESRYPVRILGEDSFEDIWIESVRAINGKNEEEAAEAIANADIMATAVGVRVLPFIAPVIAKGFEKRFVKSDKPLNIIICENLIDAGITLGSLIKNHLNEKDKKNFDERAGLVEASIGRMVPLQTAQMQDGNPLRICVEAYSTLPVDKAAFKGTIPNLTGMYPFDHFDFYIKRKLFVHNMGHAICAYLGMIKGDQYIFETVNHGGILYIAQNAMLESALALSAKYNAQGETSLSALHYHILDLLRRFSNKALGDTCARVGGDTVRKLGNKDRLIGALVNCVSESFNPVFISAGIAAALYCHMKENNTANYVQSKEAARSVLYEVSGLVEGSIENSYIEQILSYHSMFASYNNFNELIENIIKTAFRKGG